MTEQRGSGTSTAEARRALPRALTALAEAENWSDGIARPTMRALAGHEPLHDEDARPASMPYREADFFAAFRKEEVPNLDARIDRAAKPRNDGAQPG